MAPRSKAARPGLSYAAWALTDLTTARDPLARLEPDAVRIAYIAACSDVGARPELRSKQRATVRDAGGQVRGRGDQLHYLGLRLRPIRDSGYRPSTRGSGARAAGGSAGVDAARVEDGLRALGRGGLVRDGRALEVAWLALTGTPARVLCGLCGRISRHEGGHLACRKRQGR